MNFEDLDIFGVEIQLRYLNQGVYKSKYGAIITILIVCLVGLQTFLVGQELFLRKNPEVISAEQFVSFPERYDLKNDTFNFGLGVQFPGNMSHFIDESIYTMSAKMISMKTLFNETSKQYYQAWNYDPISMHPCTNDDFQVKETATRFHELPWMKDLYCIDYTNKEIYMEGNYDQESFGFIQLFFHICDGDPKCRPREESIKILTNSYVAIYNNDVIINAKDLNPFQKIQRDFFWSASPINTKDIYLYFRNVYVSSDMGVLFEQKSEQHSVIFSYLNEQMVFQEDSYFFSVIIRFETSKESIYHRKYKKLDNVLAEIGGIAKALLVVGFVLCYPINQLKLHKQLSNSLFTYGKKEETENTKHNIVGRTFKQMLQKQIFQKLKFKSNNNIFSSRTNLSMKEDNKICSVSKVSFNEQNNDLQPPQTSVRAKKENPLFIQLTENIYSNENQIVSNQDFYNNQKIPPLSPIDSNQIEKEGVEKPYATTNAQNSPKSIKKDLLTMIRMSKLIAGTKQSTQKQDEENPEKKEEILQRKTPEQDPGQIDFSFGDYLKYYVWPFGSFKKKKQQIDYSTDKIYEHLDIRYIVYKLLELEKLKQVLLDEDQIKLIQFFPKPLIDIDDINKEKRISEGNNLKAQEQNTITSTIQNKIGRQATKKQVNLLKNIVDDKQIAKDAYQALRNILKKETLTDTDCKIIEMLDAQILEQIDKNAEFLQKEVEENQEIQINSDKYLCIDKIENNQINEDTPKNNERRVKFNQKPFFSESNESEPDLIINSNNLSNDHGGVKPIQLPQQLYKSITQLQSNLNISQKIEPKLSNGSPKQVKEA